MSEKPPIKRYRRAEEEIKSEDSEDDKYEPYVPVKGEFSEK